MQKIECGFQGSLPRFIRCFPLSLLRFNNLLEYFFLRYILDTTTVTFASQVLKHYWTMNELPLSPRDSVCAKTGKHTGQWKKIHRVLPKVRTPHLLRKTVRPMFSLHAWKLSQMPTCLSHPCQPAEMQCQNSDSKKNQFAGMFVIFSKKKKKKRARI